jgi:tetratricopeptide (TPR) repeat protein
MSTLFPNPSFQGLTKLFAGVFRVFLCLSILMAGGTSQALAQSSFSHIGEARGSAGDLLESSLNRPRADTYYLLALAEARKGNIDKAFRAIATGLAIEPVNLKLLNLRAALWARQGRNEEARREFRRILAIAPDDSYARESLRTLERELKPRIAVEPGLRTAPPAAPNAPVAPVAEPSPAGSGSATAEVKLLKAEYFEEMGDKKRCLSNLSSLLRGQAAFALANPEKKDTFDLGGLVSGRHLPATPICPKGGVYTWDGGAPKCAVHGSQKDLDAEVNTVFADFNKGMTAKIGRNYQEALRAFDQVVILFPLWGEAHFQLADTLARMGSDQAAIERARTCLRHSPGNIDAKLLLANLYFKTGQKDAALGLLDSVASEQANSVYGLASRSLAAAIRSGKSYLQVFPPQ